MRILIQVKEKVSPKCKDYFTALTFAKLYKKDPYGRIAIVEFFHYVMRKVKLFLLFVEPYNSIVNYIKMWKGSLRVIYIMSIVDCIVYKVYTPAHNFTLVGMAAAIPDWAVSLRY